MCVIAILCKLFKVSNWASSNDLYSGTGVSATEPTLATGVAPPAAEAGRTVVVEETVVQFETERAEAEELDTEALDAEEPPEPDIPVNVAPQSGAHRPHHSLLQKLRCCLCCCRVLKADNGQCQIFAPPLRPCHRRGTALAQM